jgi:DNA-binding helix-hairpin-helix protein with protein kinase domain
MQEAGKARACARSGVDWGCDRAVVSPGCSKAFGSKSVDRCYICRFRCLYGRGYIPWPLSYRTIVSGVITAVLVTNARGTLAYRDEVARRKGIRQSSENLWRQFAAEWRTYFDRSNRLFDRLKKEIGELSEQILELEKNLQAAIAKARRQADEKQKEAFLGRFYISHARIEGIGEGRLAALESFGIESAADVSAGAVRRAPGIGPVLARRIVAWRRSVESKFKFDPNKSISTDESLKIHRKFSQRRVAIVNDLDRGLKRLQALSNEAEQRRKHLERAGERIAKAYAQALADCEV